MRRRRAVSRGASFWIGLLFGGVVTTAALELPYVNWHPLVPPIDARPLVVRHDAKGDGRFLAPRSGNRFHRGVDLAAPLESPVHAIRSGRVVEVGVHQGLGRFIELEHEEHLRSRYAHLSDVYVAVGKRIRQGEAVGAVGKTGNARHPWITPHLHLEVVRNGESIDPSTVGLQVVDLVEGGTVGKDVVDAGGGE